MSIYRFLLNVDFHHQCSDNNYSLLLTLAMCTWAVSAIEVGVSSVMPSLIQVSVYKAEVMISCHQATTQPLRLDHPVPPAT